VEAWQAILVVVLCTLLGAALTLACLSAMSRPPANLGADGGKLAPCPEWRNCVCSQALDGRHQIEPLRYEGSGRDAWARLRSVLEHRPRTRVVTWTGSYMHAECTSLVFRFVDDVEFVLDPVEHVIHFRSASRIGRGDFGANRRRMEAIRRAFAVAAAGG
jgi:uncharacterized protein (DUF1499 family)